MITDSISKGGIQRIRISISGVVQGVGFRPLVYRLAKELDLKGCIYNCSSGVIIEAEGMPAKLEVFLSRIRQDKPRHCLIQNLQYNYLEPSEFADFKICESDSSKSKTTLVSPDIATCPECLKEIFDSTNRRYLYPFTNCTHCGPRFSIIESIPYDRCNTSMKYFPMCADCQREYDDPLDRRFHAQPNACPQCGPHNELLNIHGYILNSHHKAIVQAADAVREGKIVAVKGVGGFHLIVDARNGKAVRLLRAKKQREEKPFALMFPSLEAIEGVCNVSVLEKSLLLSSACPIVLLSRRPSTKKKFSIASSVAPANPNLGVMLPYSPLHYILMQELNIPVVATSGNLADEPICIDEKEALQRLQGIADVFLVHNRPIVRSIDDSVVRVMMNRPLVLRRSRGYAPLPITIKTEGPSILSVGGHLKNTVALNIRNNVFISQHIGDLETSQSLQTFHHSTESLKKLYEPSLEYVSSDRHPDYFSTKFAKKTGLPVTEVQHHHAHIASCMAENYIEGIVLGIAWDGTGYGADQTVWGGEFLQANLTEFKRIAHFKTFRLPGGEKAIKEPRRTALGILNELFADRIMEFDDLPPLKAFSLSDLKLIQQMLAKGINSPVTSSAGRLFDAVASLIDLCQYVHFEGQAAMILEFVLQNGINDRYDFTIARQEDGCLIADWTNMMKEIIEDIRSRVSRGYISAKFHNTLVEMAINIAKRGQEKRVVLSGGCFQNKYITERLIDRLKQEGFHPFWHQWVPPNDGGISLGQTVVGISCNVEDR